MNFSDTPPLISQMADKRPSKVVYYYYNIIVHEVQQHKLN